MLKRTIIHFLRFLMSVIIGALSGIAAVSTLMLYAIFKLDTRDNRYNRSSGYKVNYSSFKGATE